MKTTGMSHLTTMCSFSSEMFSLNMISSSQLYSVFPRSVVLTDIKHSNIYGTSFGNKAGCTPEFNVEDGKQISLSYHWP